MANPPPSHYPNIGQLGEDLVAQWLQSQGWVILHRRFYCRWGEIDIIAQHHDFTLIFVEVKTRSFGNWDTGGKSAITLQKQTKLQRTAGIFLAQYPEKADYSCRFDVAIVHCQQISNKPTGIKATQEALATLSTDEYNLNLQEYIHAAFE